MKLTIFFIVIFAGLNCQVFCRICKVGFEEGNWVRMTPSKKLPLNCIAGGMEDSESYKGPLYIGRKRIGNELVIGKVIDAWKSGYCEFYFNCS